MSHIVRFMLVCIVLTCVFALAVVAQDLRTRPLPRSVNMAEEGMQAISKVSSPSPPAPSGAAATINVPADYATIQAAINAAGAGDVINIAAGTYVENITVTQQVTLAGAGVASTFIYPALSAPNPGGTGSNPPGSSNVILVQAHNVVIHDLTVDGDNTGLTSGIVVGGADLDARNGILTNHGVGTFNGLEVYNVTVKNIYLRGLYASSGGTFNFHDNTVTNVQAEGGSIAMFNYGGAGTFADNTVSDANDGISANHSKGTQFLDNIVTNSGSGVHTDNAGDGGGVADLIDGNTVSNSMLYGYGIWVFVPYIAPAVQNNSVTNVDVGMGSFAGPFSGPAITPVFTNNTIDGMGKAFSTGFYITNTTWYYGLTNVFATFTGNIVKNNVDGVYIESGSGYTVTFNATSNAIESNSNSGVLTGAVPAGYGNPSGLPGTVTAAMAPNWWGSSSGPLNAGTNPSGIGNSIDNGIDYSPWWGADYRGVAHPWNWHANTSNSSTIQEAVGMATAGDAVHAAAGTFNERVVLNKSLSLIGAGETSTILDGAGLVGNGSGIVLTNGIVNATIQDLTVKNYTGGGPNSYAGIYATAGNSGLTVQNVTIKDNLGGSGFYANGPLNGLTLDNLDVSGHTNVAGVARGIVVWNGLKENVTITNCDVYNNNCCGIELQDGTASGVTMSGNNIHNNGDNGIGIVGLQGPGENLISSNTLTDNGRFGIEIKNPNGSGALTGPGRIVVENNTVSRTLPIGAEVRDLVGIAAFRRGVLAGNVDIPTGTVIQNNAVSGYVQPSTSDGFGIVVEGMNHTVTGNSVSGCDVGIQRQAGHTPYPGDGNQNNLADLYFGRGNSPVTCGVTVSGNTLSNTVDTRDVGPGVTAGIVTNTNTSETFCSIQTALNDAQTLSGHTLQAGPGTYVEGPQVVVNKNISIVGDDKTTTIITPSANTGSSADARGWFLVNAGIEFNLSDVTLDGSGKNVFMAVLSHGTGTIDNNVIRNIRYQKYLGMGLMMYGGNFVISNNTLYNIERIGMYCNGPDVTNGQFIDNTYTGKGDGDWLDYGIEIERGAVATATGNTITDCRGVAVSDGSTSAGMYLTTYFAPGTTGTYLDNTVTDCYVGLEVGYGPTDGSLAVAHGNTFANNTGYGVYTTNPYVDARYNYWGTLHGPADPVGTIEVPKMPAPAVADALNALPAPSLGNAVNENVDYWPWNGPATGHAQGGIWASGYVNPTANDIFMGLDAGALDGVDPMDTVAPPPPPSDYLYLYSLLAPGMPIENYSVDIRKEEASLAATAKGWDLRALTDHTAETVNLAFLLDVLPSAFHPTLFDLTTGDYKDLSADPTYSYTSPGSVTPSPFRILIGDSTKPAVAVTAPNGGEYLIVGTPYNLTWTSSDATGVLRHYLYYSATGAAPYTLLDSTDGNVFTYAWTPLAAASTAGIKVTARDSVMNEETDISDNTFTVLASSSVSYNASAGWNLVSVPMLQGVMTPAAIFGDDYGATPYYTFGFSPSLGYSVPATLTMGQGYWLGSNSAQSIDADGTPLSGATLPLVSGFNIIGNPFASDMAVADLAFTDGSNTYDIAAAAGAGWLSNVLYGYNGTAYYIESSTLEFWNGYWVPMLADGISAVYSPTVVVPTPKAVPVVESSDPDAWKVELGATLKTEAGIETGDMIAAFGVRSDATAGFSARYDAPRPPRSPSENYIELSFTGTDAAFRSHFGDAVYARKFMPADKAGWEIVVKTSAPGDVTLRWDNSAIAALPSIVKVDLYDAATGTVIDMKTTSSYTYTQKGTEQRFSVNKPGGSVPETWELSQNYPNPFNPTTTIAYGLPSDAAVTIEVFNFLGQKVATLLTGELVQQAGYHEVTFDAATLASGFYYYTITALAGDGGNFTDVRKMILLK